MSGCTYSLQRGLNSHRVSGVVGAMFDQFLHGWCHSRLLLPSRRVLCTPFNHAPCHHFMQSHVSRVHAYLAVTSRLHSGQDDRDPLRASAAVTRGGTDTEITVSTETG